MKKASVLIVVSVLLASLICLAGCGSTSSDESASSSTTASKSSNNESDDDNSADESTSSATTSSDNSNKSSDDADAKKKKKEKYTDKETGITLSLPSDWVAFNDEELKNNGGSDARLGFYYDESPYNELVVCFAYSGFSGLSITDMSEDAVAEQYSSMFSVDKATKKKLKSGTYYQIKGTSSSDDTYYVLYNIIKGDYQIVYEYLSYGGKNNTPHLSDVESMIKNAKYK